VITELRVTGMTCGGCVKHVDKALRGVTGVSAVEVSLPDRAKVVHDPGISLDVLTGAVAKAGYSAVTLPPAGA
jgi:copper chaperone CopZ